MGKRLLRDWLVRPLADLVAIESRHSAVAVFVEDRRAAGEVGKALEGVQDVARIAGRLALDRATPRDLVALARSVARITELSRSLSNMPALFFAARALDQVSGALSLFASRTNAACVDDPPAHLREGGLFRDGIDAELDEYRLLQRDAGTWLTAFQQRLAAECNLPGIKVGFNRVFGYYIELTASQAKSAPALLTRKQTLKNAERYTTLELRDFESKVLSAETRSYERERVLFAGLCDDARTLLAPIQKYADTVATVDALLGFADRASAKGWVRPTMVPEPVLAIENARHPVLEEVLGADFVPNDAAMGAGEGSLALITGPNMAGKSTFIRQVALVVLLAHAGSFVPASRATIGLTDRIFTRIGADDALHAGQSTFMVEMTETANILNNASPRSLVILDEIGRGTSTLDGLSLAWAIAEFLGGLGSRTLFATHYHELTDLQDRLPARVRNLHVAVREWSTPDGHHEIVFLHRILPGATDQSYGIHVARLAGIPASVVVRAREVLDSLAVHHAPLSSARADTTNVPVAMPPPDGQMMLFTQYIPHPAIAHLKEVKLDTLSPMQAFDLLRQLRESAISPAP
jgi:DNA mismatch repair protein MutS